MPNTEKDAPCADGCRCNCGDKCHCGGECFRLELTPGDPDA